MADVTDQNFQDQVLKSTKPVLVDFWAPWCIDPQTPILTKYGYIKASAIKVEMEVMTANPNTYALSLKKVTKTKIIPHVVSKKITLETGKILIGDSNHLVLTKKGFKSLQDLTVDDSILVDPREHEELYTSSNTTTLLDSIENNFADKQLRELQILPLLTNYIHLPILARLLGFVMTDGYLYQDTTRNTYETHFYVGTEEDALQIKKDLKALGFETLEIKKQVEERQIAGRKFTMHILRCRNLNRSFFFLLKGLGAPIGRKKNQAYGIPDWIINGEQSVKVAFLSGWLGGDGCKIDFRAKAGSVTAHDAQFSVNPIEFHKEKELEKEGLAYAQQLSLLLMECGVKTKEIKSMDDEDGVIISVRLATDYYSLLNLTKIEYAYAHTKNKAIPFLREFLAYRLFEREEYAQIKQVVLQQLAIGIDSQMIAQNMHIPLKTVTSWKYTTSTKTTHPSLKGQARFDYWIEERKEEELLWEKINSSEDAGVRDVIGITVEAPHTLITNSMVSHNCGPCRIVSPIVEELGEEYKDKVTVVKMNVDDNPQVSGQYGVMSIPTLMVFKNGQPVKSTIGAQPKEALKKMLDESLAA